MARLNPQAHQPMQGEAAPKPVTRENAPPMPLQPSNSIFKLQWHRKRWCVMAGRVVPSMRQWPIQPGLGGVDKSGAYRAAEAQAAERGWHSIPWDVDGPTEEDDYTRRYRVRAGHFYCTKWTQVWADSEEIGSDVEGYSKWLLSLIEREVIPPPAPFVLTKMIERLRSRQLALAGKVRAEPNLQGELDGVTDNIKALTAEQKRIGPPNPKDAMKPSKRAANG